MTDKDEVLSRFESITLDDLTWAKVGAVEHRIQQVADELLEQTRPGRAQSLALTKLEEAKMWAFRAAAEDQEAAK